jgi:hypothetical protein
MLSRDMMPAVLLATLSSMVQPAPSAPGSALRPGMSLVYQSDGKAQPPWTVEAVTIAAPLKEGASCSIVRLRRAPGPPEPADVRYCSEGGMLLVWSATQNAWTPQRPVSPGLTLTQPRPNGEVVAYVTGTVSDVSIGGITVSVIETTVTTQDATGRPLRRLREQYAPSLTTAVSGRFEVPDPNDVSGWRTTQAFELREIR